MNGGVATLLLLASRAAVASPAVPTPVTEFVLRIDHPRSGEQEELARLLGVPPGGPMNADAVAALERRLMETGRFRSVVCKLDPDAGSTTLFCAAATARVIRRIRFEGVPFKILQADLEKRVFIRPGQRADLTVGEGESRISRQQKRIADYLLREGVFGAEVRVLTEDDDDDLRAADLLVAIAGGETVSVREISVEGEGPLSVAEIDAALRPGLLGSFSPWWLRERAEELERRLREERGYPEAQLSARYELDLDAGEVDLQVRIHAGPHLAVFFTGEVGADEAALREQLSFALAGTADATEVEISRRAVLRWLQLRGYAVARVGVVREEPDPDRVVVRFDLTRGPRAAVEEVVLRGPPALDLSGLARSVELGIEPRAPVGTRGVAMVAINLVPGWLQRWLNLDTIGRAVADKIEADRQRLEKAVVDLGYPEGVVTARVERLTPETLRLVYRVEPGASFQLKRIDCDGNTSVSCGDIRAALVHRVGGPFMLDAFDVERGRVLGLYAQRGFPYASAEVMADFDDRGRPVMRVVVEEGARARLSALLIDGNLDTQRAVVGREIDVAVGGALDPIAADAGMRRLRRTGLFARVNGRYLGLEEQRRDLAYQISVEERRSLTLDTALNFSTAELFGLEAELRERNLLGLAVDARAAGRFGLVIGRRTFLRGSFGWPRVWGTPLGLTISSGFDVSDRPISPKPLADNLYGLGQTVQNFVEEGAPDDADARQTLYGEDVQRTQVLSNKLKLDFPLTSALRLFAIYEIGIEWRDGLSRVGVELVETGARLDASQPITIKGGVPISALSTRLEYRRLDNPFNPGRGVQLQGGIKLGSRYYGAQLLEAGARALGVEELEALSDFAIASGGVQAYHTEGPLTLAGSLRTAIGLPISRETEQDPRRYIPSRDLIVAGGDRTVRGHGSQPSLGIHEVLRTSDGSIIYDPETRQPKEVVNPGMIGVVANLELRTLVVRNLWIGDLQWALFVDGAFVADEPPDTEDLSASLESAHFGKHLGLGIGTGPRYVTPVGPIILDLALDPLRLPNGSVHFTFGYAF